MLKFIQLTFSLLMLSFVAKATPIKEGNWQGIIHYKSVDVPFIFNLKNISDSMAIITIINGDEKIHIDNAFKKGDSIFIPMYVFDAEIRAIINDNKMEGVWHKNYKDQKDPLFSAHYETPRFTSLEPIKRTIYSDWEITFKQPFGQTSQAVGSFKNLVGNQVTGTVLTEVGDFRYFEGILYGDSIRLSSFDGVHGFLMLGEYKNNRWQGKFYYDYTYVEEWDASPNANAKLADPFELIEVEPFTYKPYYDILTAGGEYNAIDTDRLDNKVVIIQLMGTWCPNSLDQTKYLMEWYPTQKKNEVEIIAVTYEPGNKIYAQNRINAYSSKFNLPYPMYIGGKMSKGQAALAFPNLNKINAFPTLIMIDKKGYIRYINSYFNGPATGSLYNHFDKTFKAKLHEMLNE